jgi:hypothetical protein
MSDTLIPPEKDKLPSSHTTEPPRHVDYAELPPGITLKPEGFAVKRPIFVTSVAVMVFTSLVTFYIPFFNGLLGGAFGGFHAGRWKRALAAAVVSSVMVPLILAFAHFISERPQLLFMMGLTTWEWVACHVAGTILGALTGAFARPRITERDIYRRRTV